MPSAHKHRVMLALTESSRARPLWRAAMDLLVNGEGELIAVFVADERWEQAARLPFTREISAVTGATRDFTQDRARELINEAANRVRRKLEKLAAKRRRTLVFEVITGVDQGLIERLSDNARLTVIVPSELSGSPIYLTLQRQQCEIVLVNRDEDHERTSGGSAQ